MLINTFLHVPGICLKRERSLWNRGFLEWDDILSGNKKSIQKATQLSSDLVEEHIYRSQENLGNKNVSFFLESIPSSETWRLFPEFKDHVAYLDIETTGLSKDYNVITTIALYDGREIHYYVRDRNLHDFVHDINKYKVIVTFNGKCFDIPFIEKEFGIQLRQAHIDLRFVLKSLGYRGGLKSCEKQLGIDRHELEGVDGYYAVLLWQDYTRNDNIKALETLLAYNIEDVINLETLLTKSYNMKLETTPFRKKELLLRTKKPEVPFSPDAETIEKIGRWIHR